MILGGSRYYIRSIIAAKELGCEVVVTDRNSQAEGFSHAHYYEVMDITDIEGSLEVAKKYAIDGIVPVNDFGVRTAAVISEELGLVGISPKVAEYATNKAWMRKKWREAGVPSAMFKVAECLEEAYAAVEELNTWPLVVKPIDSRGGGSRGVSKIDNRSQLTEALEFAQSFYENKSVIIEEFLDGVEHSVETITYNGEPHVLAVSDKVKTPPPFRVDKSVDYPTIFKEEKLRRIHEVAKIAVRALGIKIGPAHIEMCSTPDGPRLIELGARCGGGGTPDPIVPFLTGIEMFKEVVRIALGESPQQLIPLYTKGCVYRFITPEPGRVRRVTGLEDITKWKNILDCEVLIKEGGDVKAVRTGADRAGFIIAGGETRDEAVALANRAEQHIIFER